MYTTLNLLKQSRACVPGYGRMLEFFGLDKKNKNQKIPIHVVALAGESDDASWAIDNAFVIDPADYVMFYEKHLVAVWKHLMNNNVGLRSRLDSTESNLEKYCPAVKELVARAFAAHTYEDVHEIIMHTHTYHGGHPLFTKVLNSPTLNIPIKFICYVIEILEATYTIDQKIADKTRFGIPNTLEVVPAVVEDDADDDEDEDEDDEDDDEPTRRTPVRAQAAANNGKKSNVYYLTTSKPEFNFLQKYVHAFSDTPYDFMHTMQYRLPKSVNRVKAANGVNSMTFVCTSAEDMYAVVNLLNHTSSSTIPQAQIVADLRVGRTAPNTEESRNSSRRRWGISS